MPFGLSDLAAKLIIVGLMFLAGLGLGVYVTRGLEQNKYKELELQYKDAQIKAVVEAQQKQHDLDMIAVQAAQKESSTQAALTAQAKRQLAEVSKHVKDRPNSCITYGLVRVLDASVHGVLADSLNLPSNKSDDACTELRAADLARSVVANYNTANANKEQLNAIIAYLRQVQTQQEQWAKQKH